MKKQTVTGYIPKTLTDETGKVITIDNFGTYRITTTVFCKRGIKAHWIDADWPPVKVKITIEVVE